MKYKIQSGSFAFFLHRITGIMLIAYLLLHIYVLTGLYNPQSFAKEMEILTHPVAQALEFLLLLPILFHSINGLRLVIVEWTSSGSRNQKKMLVAVYIVCSILALGMLLIFFKHEPYEKYRPKVNEYTKRATEHVTKKGGQY